MAPCPADAPFPPCLLGTCANASCACPDGMAALGDFVAPGQGFNCVVSLTAVRALWGLNILANCALLGVAGLLWQRNSATSRRLLDYILAAVAGLSAVLFIVVGGIKLNDPLRSIGVDVTITVLFSQAASCSWAFIWLYVLGPLDLIPATVVRLSRAGVSASSARYISLFSRAHPFGFFLSILFCEIPCLLLALNDNHWAFYAVTALHSMGLGIITVWGALALVLILGPIIKQLEQLSKTEASGQTGVGAIFGAKLRRIRDATTQEAAFVFAIGGVLALWPFAQKLFCYWIPFRFTSVSILFCVGIHVNLPAKTAPRAGQGTESSSKSNVHYASFIQSVDFDLRVVRNDAGAESQADINEVERLIHDGQVVSDMGGIVNVATKHTRTFSLHDTLLGRMAPRLFKIFLGYWRRTIETKGETALALGMAVFTSFGVVLAALTMTLTVPGFVAYAYVPVFLMYVAGAVSFLNLGVVHAVLRTSFFFVRFFSAVVSTVCLCVVLADERILIILCLFALQVIVSLGDCIAGEVFGLVRVVFAIQLVVNLVVLLVGLFFAMIPYTFNTVIISPSFDYSLIQLARDLYLGTFIVTMFDVSFVLKGTHKRRFAILRAPVRCVLRTFEEEAASELYQGPVILEPRFNASQLVVQSGFMAAQPSQAGAPHARASVTANGTVVLKPKVLVFVNVICLSQRDAVACHLLGADLGAKVFHALESKTASFVDAACTVMLFPVLAAPWLPNLVLFLVPCMIYQPIRRFLLSSRSMLRLLMGRRQVQLNLVFLLIWVGLFLAVFNNVFAIIALTVLGVSLTEIFKDASLRQSRKTIRSLVRTKILIGISVLSYSCYMVAGLFDATTARHYYVNFSPDASNKTGVPYSDQVSVVDIFQQTIDMSVAIGLGHWLTGALLLWYHNVENMATLQTPVIPEFTE